MHCGTSSGASSGASSRLQRQQPSDPNDSASGGRSSCGTSGQALGSSSDSVPKASGTQVGLLCGLAERDILSAVGNGQAGRAAHARQLRKGRGPVPQRPRGGPGPARGRQGGEGRLTGAGRRGEAPACMRSLRVHAARALLRPGCRGSRGRPGRGSGGQVGRAGWWAVGGRAGGRLADAGWRPGTAGRDRCEVPVMCGRSSWPRSSSSCVK